MSRRRIPALLKTALTYEEKIGEAMDGANTAMSRSHLLDASHKRDLRRAAKFFGMGTELPDEADYRVPRRTTTLEARNALGVPEQVSDENIEFLLGTAAITLQQMGFGEHVESVNKSIANIVIKGFYQKYEHYNRRAFDNGFDVNA